MNAQDADANAYPDMAVWHPDQMAYDALQDCGHMLKAAKDGSDQSNYDRQRAFRKALRAAHDAPTCLDAIAGGVIVAEWALRRAVGKTDDRGLGYFIGQIRGRLPGWAQPAAQNGSRAA